MKTVGILGGMSWESTLLYYKWLNEGISARLGGLHSARIVLHSLDFGPVEAAMAAGDWDTVEGALLDGARSVRDGGADFLLIATNTMHRFADRIEQEADIPVLHIADATARHAQTLSLRTVGLLGTAYTMEQPFYKGRLEDQHNLTVLVPEQDQRRMVHEVIFSELCHGILKDTSRNAFTQVIATMKAQGAQAVILGCTEICLLVDDSCSALPTLDTTRLHVEAALDAMLA